MTRAEGGLDRDAKMLRDKYRVPYTMARKLVQELGVGGAIEACEADHAQRAHTIESHVAHGPNEPSTVVGGVCAVCGEAVDAVAAKDFLEGPRLVVELTYAMELALRFAVRPPTPMLDTRHVYNWTQLHGIQVRPLDSRREEIDDPGESDSLYIGRRDDLDRLADEFRNLGRSNHEHGAPARHAAHRIEAALKGART